jgi:hypothetical protein
MENVNFGVLTYDDINDISIRITDKLVKLGYVPDCTDTDNESEFEVQDIIVSELLKNPKNKTK